MGLSVADVRQRIASALSALGGWTESRYAAGAFGRDTDHIMHKAFAVGTLDTVPLGGRQRLAKGTPVNTSVVVVFAHRIRGDAQVSDTDAAADAEQLLIQTVLAVPRTGLHIRWERTLSRQLAEPSQDWLITEVQFLAQHHFDLE